MKVKLYGTRGSIPVSGPEMVRYGGNTTSLLIMSDCLPKDFWLVVDTGSGFVPLSYDALKAGVKNLAILYTHYHFDHTIGLTLAPVTFIRGIKIIAYGPVEHGIGTAQMMKDLLKSPYFPVDFNEVKSHIQCKSIDIPNSNVFVIHPEGGLKYFTIDQIECYENEGSMVPFDKGKKYDLSDCLLIRMYRSNHPERTISYRFEEKPTGKVFVLLTDHENQDGMPQRLLAHIKDADLLIMDSQYDRARYESSTAGYGHGTPDYCVRVAVKAKAKKLGLTHHDPTSSDKKVDEIVAEAKKWLSELGTNNIEIFACFDYQEIEL